MRKIITIGLIAIGGIAAGCSGSSSDYSLSEIEDTIKTDWLENGSQFVDEWAVQTVDCSETSSSDADAKCIINYTITVAGEAPFQQTAGVDVTYTDDGGFIWEAS